MRKILIAKTDIKIEYYIKAEPVAVQPCFINGGIMSNTLHFTSPIPPSVNHYMGYRAIMKNGKPLSVQYKTNEAKKYCKTLSDIIYDAVVTQNWTNSTDKKQHFYVDAVFYFPRVRMDSNNYWKVMLDVITDTKLIWYDDNVVCERTQAIYYDTNNPRVEVSIHPVDYIGVFNDESQLKDFESGCIDCAKYRDGKCEVMRKAKEGRIQEYIKDNKCSKYDKKKS